VVVMPQHETSSLKNKFPKVKKAENDKNFPQKSKTSKTSKN
jgi:hypothetical protein